MWAKYTLYVYIHNTMTKWFKKKTVQEKKKTRYAKRLCETFRHPTRQQLRQLTFEDLEHYCQLRTYNVETTSRIKEIWHSSTKDETFNYDYRDLRTIPRENRVPRSLEERPTTPPGYWDITDPINPE